MLIKTIEMTAITLAVATFVSMSPRRALSSEDTGRLQIRVKPKQAYVFVDGKAVRAGNQTIRLAPGAHAIEVHNYGYVANKQKVQVSPSEKTKLDVDLQPSGDKVEGPFADLEFKGDPRAAVLLNEVTPAYFVGHVDEFNWDWITPVSAPRDL